MRYHRKTAPGVRSGQVQKKNRWRGEPDYSRTHQVRIERYRARRGYRHYLSPTDIHAFLALLPEWRELSIGLTRIVLSSDIDCLGWHRAGTIAVCNWEEKTAQVLSTEFYSEHAGTLARLGVPCRPVNVVRCCLCPAEIPVDDQRGLCERCQLWCPVEFDVTLAEPVGSSYFAEFTDQTLQAFLLLRVLVHELGHHHDRMTSPQQYAPTRGESYAEEYALRHEARIWEEYRRVFRVR